jgi:GntR family transcriptional regulator of vanillate catabolism
MSSAIDGLKRDKEAEPAGSQAVKALLALREMVLAGELPAASRIAEVALAERLGVSRTPIRAALMRLEQEGLLEPLPGGGYTVRTFSERDISDAIELRGTLEGLLARLAAERGAAQVVLNRACASMRSTRCWHSRRSMTSLFRATCA